MSYEVPTMDAKTSWFNATVFRKTLLRCWPLWAATALILILRLPVGLLFNRYGSFDIYTLVSAERRAPLACLLGLVCGRVTFSFLFQKRGTEPTDAPPVRSEELFCSSFAAGLVMLLSSLLLAAVLAAVIALAEGVHDLSAVWTWLGVWSMGLVLFYAIGVFCAVLKCSALVLIPLYTFMSVGGIFFGMLLAFHWELIRFAFAAVLTFGSLRLFKRRTTEGAREPVTSSRFGQVVKYIVTFISAIVMPIMIDLFLDSGEEGDEAIICILFGLPFFLTLGAVLGYLISEMILRRSARDREESGSGGGLKFILTVLGALGLPMAIARFFGPDPANSMAGLLASTAIGAAIGYLICEMILLKSGRVRKLGWKGLVISVAVILVVGGAGRLNETRSAQFVPDPAEVESAELTLFKEVETTLTDPDAIKELTDIHRELTETEDPESWDMVVDVTYHLENGKTLTRSYNVVDDGSEDGTASRLLRLTDRGETFDPTIEPLHELTGSAIRSAELKWTVTRQEDSGPNIQRFNYPLTESDVLDLYENAILPDLEAGAFRISVVNGLRVKTDLCIEFWVHWEDTGTQYLRYLITPEATHTIAWLTAHGCDLPELE